MEPDYLPGDHVLTFNWILPKIYNVIVFEKDGTFYLKRIVKIKKDLIFVKGDNNKVSSKIGPIRSLQLIGKVILKY